ISVKVRRVLAEHPADEAIAAHQGFILLGDTDLGREIFHDGTEKNSKPVLARPAEELSRRIVLAAKQDVACVVARHLADRIDKDIRSDRHCIFSSVVHRSDKLVYLAALPKKAEHALGPLKPVRQRNSNIRII